MSNDTVDTRKARVLSGFLLVLVSLSGAAALWLSRPAARSSLVLPATPYRYANVDLPAHFTQPGRNHDNTPPDNPLERRRRHAGPRSVLRHAAVGK